jgi:hypothetical protein
MELNGSQYHDSFEAENSSNLDFSLQIAPFPWLSGMSHREISELQQCIPHQCLKLDGFSAQLPDLCLPIITDVKYFTGIAQVL